jgi:hypothetical protein
MKTSITLLFLASIWACTAQAEDDGAIADSTEVVTKCTEWDTYFSYQLESDSRAVYVVYKRPPSFEPVANKYLEKRRYKITQRCPDSAEKIHENEDEIIERSMRAEVVDTIG